MAFLRGLPSVIVSWHSTRGGPQPETQDPGLQAGGTRMRASDSAYSPRGWSCVLERVPPASTHCLILLSIIWRDEIKYGGTVSSKYAGREAAGRLPVARQRRLANAENYKSSDRIND